MIRDVLSWHHSLSRPGASGTTPGPPGQFRGLLDECFLQRGERYVTREVHTVKGEVTLASACGSHTKIKGPRSNLILNTLLEGSRKFQHSGMGDTATTARVSVNGNKELLELYYSVYQARKRTVPQLVQCQICTHEPLGKSTEEKILGLLSLKLKVPKQTTLTIFSPLLQCKKIKITLTINIKIK